MTGARTGARAARAGLVVTLIAMLVVVGSDMASAAPPTLTNPPERLYTQVNTGFDFTGTDLISDDDRELVLTTNDDDCDPLADNDQEPGPDYFLGGCARVQMGVSHGELAIPLDHDLNDLTEPDGIHAGGAIVESSTNEDGTGPIVNLNGTQDQLNDALADLSYTPDTDYEYEGGNPEGLDLLIINGADSDSFTYEVEIRVEQENDWPTLTAPTGPFDVAANSSTPLPTVEPGLDELGDFFVEDPDIEDPALEDEMMLIMFATCGEFSLRGNLTLENDLVEALVDYLDIPQDAAEALVALLPPEVTGQPFATGSPLDPNVAIAAIGSFDEINYALGQVTFDSAGHGRQLRPLDDHHRPRQQRPAHPVHRLAHRRTRRSAARLRDPRLRHRLRASPASSSTAASR